jgi:hypothetical protein
MQEMLKRAIELFADEIRHGRHLGGNTPWVTGNMVRSILSELNSIVQVKPGGDDGSGNFTGKPGQVEAQAALMGPDDVISIGFQAIYAARVNYGFVGADSLGRNYNQEGAHFLEAAIAKWPECVMKASEELFGLMN